VEIKLKELITFHPFLFAIFPIVFIYSINSHEIKFEEIFSLFIIILPITFAIIFILNLILKNKKAIGFIVSIGFMIFFSYGHIHNLISSNSELRHIYLISVFFIFFSISVYYFVKTKRKLDNATKITNAVGIILIVISGMNIVSDNIAGNTSIDFINTSSSINSSQIDDKPNVYYIILDAYAGQDVLNNYFEYDNNEFISFLEDNNFHVVSHALTNYPTTALSLSSSLNMQYLDCVESSKIIREEFRESESCFSASTAYDMIQNNEVMKKLNQEGYTIINSYSGIEPTRNFDIAFSNLCGRYSGIMNSELTITLIGKSILNPIYVKLFEDVKRDQILCVLSELEEVHKKYDKSIFVFAHLMLPHHPYIFGPNGESISPEKMEAKWEGLENDKEGYLNQVKFANQKLKQIITTIIDESSNPPIIIIQGDHGLKSEIKNWNNPTNEELHNRLSIFNAYHIPTTNELPYKNITPVNSFRIIFNELFDEQLEILPNINYWLYDEAPIFREVNLIFREN
jgi:hypothetical protein